MRMRDAANILRHARAKEVAEKKAKEKRLEEQKKKKPGDQRLCKECRQGANKVPILLPCGCPGATGSIHLHCLEKRSRSRADYLDRTDESFRGFGWPRNWQCEDCGCLYQGIGLLALAADAHAMIEDSDGPETLQTVRALQRLGLAFYFAGDLEEAVDCFERVYAWETRRVFGGEASFARACFDLGVGLNAKGWTEEAKVVLQKPLEGLDKHVLKLRARLYGKRSEFQRAMAMAKGDRGKPGDKGETLVKLMRDVRDDMTRLKQIATLQVGLLMELAIVCCEKSGSDMAEKSAEAALFIAKEVLLWTDMQCVLIAVSSTQQAGREGEGGRSGLGSTGSATFGRFVLGFIDADFREQM